MTHSSPENADTEGYTEGYAASLRQQADLMEKANAGKVSAYVAIDDFDVDGLREAADFIERISAQQMNIPKLETLVRQAFNEGVSAGMKDFTSSKGGVTWIDSKAKAALSEFTSPERWTAQDIAEAKAEAKEMHDYFHPIQPQCALEAAAEHVCWFDWSSNDTDAVDAIEGLRKALAHTRPDDPPCSHPRAEVWFYRDDDTYMRCPDCKSKWVGEPALTRPKCGDAT